MRTVSCPDLKQFTVPYHHPQDWNASPCSRSERGFTLLELMVASTLLMVVTGAVLLLLHQGQQAFESESRMSRSSNQVRLAMDHIVRSIRHAGNDPHGYLRANDIPPIEILDEEQNQIRVNSDLTGAVDSTTGNAAESTGDPDGGLDSIYERTTYRYDPNSKTLFVNVGYGENVLVSGVTDFGLTFVDKQGDTTTAADNIASAKVWIVGTAQDSAEF